MLTMNPHELLLLQQTLHLSHAVASQQQQQQQHAQQQQQQQNGGYSLPRNMASRNVGAAALALALSKDLSQSHHQQQLSQPQQSFLQSNLPVNGASGCSPVLHNNNNRNQDPNPFMLQDMHTDLMFQRGMTMRALAETSQQQQLLLQRQKVEETMLSGVQQASLLQLLLQQKQQQQGPQRDSSFLQTSQSATERLEHQTQNNTHLLSMSSSSSWEDPSDFCLEDKSNSNNNKATKAEGQETREERLDHLRRVIPLWEKLLYDLEKQHGTPPGVAPFQMRSTVNVSVNSSSCNRESTSPLSRSSSYSNCSGGNSYLQDPQQQLQPELGHKQHFHIHDGLHHYGSTDGEEMSNSSHNHHDSVKAPYPLYDDSSSLYEAQVLQSPSTKPGHANQVSPSMLQEFSELDCVDSQRVSFPAKLYRIIMDAAASSSSSAGNSSSGDNEQEELPIVSFTASGRAFRINRPVEFMRDIAPKYFRSKNIKSFKRLLNLYGFKAVSRGSEVYAHEFFQRGQPELLRKITRVPETNIVVGMSAHSIAVSKQQHQQEQQEKHSSGYNNPVWGN